MGGTKVSNGQGIYTTLAPSPVLLAIFFNVKIGSIQRRPGQAAPTFPAGLVSPALPPTLSSLHHNDLGFWQLQL